MTYYILLWMNCNGATLHFRSHAGEDKAEVDMAFEAFRHLEGTPFHMAEIIEVTPEGYEHQIGCFVA